MGTDEQAYAYTIFCDDIRDEVGSKQSYIGVYGSDLIIGGVRPATLPKLCIIISAVIPRDMAFRSPVTIALLREVSGETELLTQARSEPPKEDQLPAPTAKVQMRAILVLAPLEVNVPCKLKTRVLVGDLELKAGSLKVSFADDVQDREQDLGKAG